MLTALSTQTFIAITFTVDPVSINTTLNSTVIFTCEATAVDELTFIVNEESANHGVHKGFTQSTSGSYYFKTGRLQAIAYDINNNTNIRCRASNDVPTVRYSETALLLIQGSECLFWQSYYFSLLI